MRPLQWLIDRNPLIIMPSLADNSPCVIYECLNHKLRFITTSVGGMSELIAEEDLSHTVTPSAPKQLASFIKEVVSETKMQIAPRPRADWQKIADIYVALFSEEQGPATPACRVNELDVRVTFVVTHYERPRLLSRALEGIEMQTHANVE